MYKEVKFNNRHDCSDMSPYVTKMLEYDDTGMILRHSVSTQAYDTTMSMKLCH